MLGLGVKGWLLVTQGGHRWPLGGNYLGTDHFRPRENKLNSVPEDYKVLEKNMKIGHVAEIGESRRR